MTIRIWDAKTGAEVRQPLEGHNTWVWSVACSPDGQHIISGSSDGTIRIWDAETGVTVGKPLEGHTSSVISVAYSPTGRHIISGSNDKTIRIWDVNTGGLVGKPLNGHSDCVVCVAYSPNGKDIVSGSLDSTIHLWSSLPCIPTQHSPSYNPNHPHFHRSPDPDGWVRDSENGLLYWVPTYCRMSLHSPARLKISQTPDLQSVALDFEDFAFGTSWTHIFNNVRA